MCDRADARVVIGAAVLGVVLGAVQDEVAVPPPVPDWNHDIAPLVGRACATCHQAGGAGPFRLDRRNDFARRGEFVLELVDEGRMPPWLGRGDGWRDDRRLSSDDKSLLRRWIQAGAPIDRSDPDAPAITATVPASTKVPGRTEMRAVDGEFTLPMESDPAWHQGEIDQRGNTIPLGNQTPWRVRGIEIDTGAAQAMRVASIVFDDTGAGRYLDDRDPRVGFLMAGDAGLSPSGAHGVILGGVDRLRWPDGFHLPVPVGADAVVEWHYRPTGVEETMRPRLMFELLSEEEAVDSRPLRWLPVGLGRIKIGAEAVATMESSMVEVPVEVDLVGVTPRGLEIATAMELCAFAPDSPSDAAGEVVIRFEDWDHHQRETIISETPRRFAAGTRFQASFRLDNRSENPSNPDSPAKDIARGRRTGVLAILLHLAAVEADDDASLAECGPEAVKALMRPRRGP